MKVYVANFKAQQKLFGKYLLVPGQCLVVVIVSLDGEQVFAEVYDKVFLLTDRLLQQLVLFLQ